MIMMDANFNPLSRLNYELSKGAQEKLNLARNFIKGYIAARQGLQQTQTTFRFRWNKQVINDSRIERIVWPDEKNHKS